MERWEAILPCLVLMDVQAKPALKEGEFERLVLLGDSWWGGLMLGQDYCRRHWWWHTERCWWRGLSPLHQVADYCPVSNFAFPRGI